MIIVDPLAWLEKALALRDGQLHGQGPAYDSIRDDPRFHVIIERLKL